MPQIDVDIDRYGTLARPSYLADYLEILALRGKVCTQAQLEDLVEDRWSLRRRAKTILPSDTGAEDVVAAAWTCLLERSEIIGDGYPFDVTSSRVVLKRGLDIRDSSYVALLCITMAHAHKIASGFDVEQVFEETVAIGLEAIGMTVGRFGKITRANKMNFPVSLSALGSQFEMPVDHQAASRRGSANDAGLDVLAILEWGDNRLGRWVFLGQVTCGSSDTWSSKLAEVKEARWQRLLKELTTPVSFLAVPHHVDKRSYYEVVEGDSKAVVDRARLARRLRSTGADERIIIDAVLASDFEDLAV